MAVQATTRHRAQLPGGGGRGTGQRCSLTRMTGVAVAFLQRNGGRALSRLKHCCHGRCGRWCSLPSPAGGCAQTARASPCGTGSSLVDAVLLQLLGIIAMDIVAIRAPHLAFQHRVMGRLVEQRTLLLVTTEAQLGLVCRERTRSWRYGSGDSWCSLHRGLHGCFRSSACDYRPDGKTGRLHCGRPQGLRSPCRIYRNDGQPWHRPRRTCIARP